MHGKGAVTRDVIAAHATLVVGGIKQRFAAPFDRRLDSVARRTCNRPDHCINLIASDQLLCTLHRSLGIGAVIGLDDFNLATQYATSAVDFVHQHLDALHCLRAKHCQPARKRHEHALF